MIVFLDTNVVIYAVELHAAFGLKAQSRIALALAAGDTLMASDLVRMECLVGPLKLAKPALEKAFRNFLAPSNVQVVGITAAVCDRAASIRATFNFKSLDALQLAAALEHGANVFLTSDARLNSYTGLTVEVLK